MTENTVLTIHENAYQVVHETRWKNSEMLWTMLIRLTKRYRASSTGNQFGGPVEEYFFSMSEKNRKLMTNALNISLRGTPLEGLISIRET